MFARIARLALIVFVTAGIFMVSASHIIAVAEEYGNHGMTAYVYPLCIDGVILISAFTLVATQGAVGADTKKWATCARYFGFIATIFCNVEHSGYGTFSAIVVNLIPAIALIFTMEITVLSVKSMASAQRRAKTRKAKETTAKVMPLRAVA